MQLSYLFSKETMVLNLTVDTKDQALSEMADQLVKAGKMDDKTAFLEALQAREDQSTTGVGDEIAIPHAQSAYLSQPEIVFARAADGVEWESLDGQPAKLLFMIAAPKDGSNEHLSALAKLSGVLMKPGVKDTLLAAEDEDEVIDLFASYEEEEESAEESDAQAVAATSPGSESEDDQPYILAVTACPTGIAHTFMAEEKLKESAKAKNIDIKVETNGQNGVNNRLTKSDIDRATAIIVAADKQVEMARFDG